MCTRYERKEQAAKDRLQYLAETKGREEEERRQQDLQDREAKRQLIARKAAEDLEMRKQEIMDKFRAHEEHVKVNAPDTEHFLFPRLRYLNPALSFWILGSFWRRLLGRKQRRRRRETRRKEKGRGSLLLKRWAVPMNVSLKSTSCTFALFSLPLSASSTRT